jgi:hypothetical protein
MISKIRWRWLREVEWGLANRMPTIASVIVYLCVRLLAQRDHLLRTSNTFVMRRQV